MLPRRRGNNPGGMAVFQQTQPGFTRSARFSAAVALPAIPLVLRLEYAAVLLGVLCFSLFLGIWGLAVAAGTRGEMQQFPLIRATGDILLALIILGAVALVIFGALQIIVPISS